MSRDFRRSFPVLTGFGGVNGISGLRVCENEGVRDLWFKATNL